MGIRDLSDKELENFIRNYRKAGKTEGGIYTLAELLMEQLRRSGSVFSGKIVATKILTLAQSSDDNLTTYHDLWNDLYPDREWIGHNSKRIIKDDLDLAIHYCVKNKLPIVTVLVVPKIKRRLTEKAINNIYNRCRELGVQTGLIATEFVDQQVEAACNLDISSLP